MFASNLFYIFWAQLMTFIFGLIRSALGMQ
jgi:hypothetical protein